MMMMLFGRLRAANLKLKPSKCSLLRTEVSFLGHVVSGDGVSTDPEEIKAVRDWPVPTDIREVRSILGLASYYRKFVPAFTGKIGKMRPTRISWEVPCV